MIRNAFLSFALFVLLGPALAAQEPAGSDGGKASWSAGLMAGYKSGFGIQANGMVSNFTPSFPVMARLGISYVSVDAGRPLDARRVFINDATNGVPEENGRVWEFGLDLLYPVRLLSLQQAYVFGGLRHSRFSGNFKFVGGNEDFDIESNHWGLGGGLEIYFPVNRRFDMVLNGGFNYLFSGRMTGHDTSYSPDGDDVNPRQGYNYSDADAAVGQPKLEPQFMLGFSYSL